MPSRGSGAPHTPAPSLRQPSSSPELGFAFAEVLIAIAVCVLLGAAAFAANRHLLLTLKSQKESTAATMLLQQRMEAFRAASYSQVTENPSDAGSLHYVRDHIVAVPTSSEAGLGNLSETITVSGYQPAPAPSPAIPAAKPYSRWTRDSSYPTGQEQAHADNLVTQYDLVRVDIQINWLGSNSRQHTRALSAVFGKGNIGP